MKWLVIMESIRWAFNTRHWCPSKSDWITALRCIQPEEKERIGRFVFKKDAKSSMAGRLMLRKLAAEKLGLSWSCAKFDRTEKGRPYLVNAITHELEQMDFNVSHQGDWAVLAADVGYKVGVDVMKVEYIGGKSVSEFFHTMRRQFTAEEWQQVKSYSNERDQLASFYRHWCLKEGVVKALGVGIGFELQRVSFELTTPTLRVNEVTNDTKVRIDGELDPHWYFEETMLDENHSTAVALHYEEGKTEVGLLPRSSLYQHLSFDELIANSEHITSPDPEAAQLFIEKEETPWK